MSTRSMVDFYEEEPKKDIKPVARIYHHWDGYPSSRLRDIKKAVDRANKAYQKEPGFSYRIEQISSYMPDLASYYILANKPSTAPVYDKKSQLTKKTTKRTAGNVEIDNNLHSDIEYLYQVWGLNAIRNKSGHLLNKQEIRVNILVPEDFKKFWDKPDIKAMKLKDSGELNQLIKRYHR